MILNKNWRILTIGDGDLSFSYSLQKYHSPLNLVATVYDDKVTMTQKYGDDFYQKLKTANIPVFFSFDITDPKSWGNISKESFDVVIFQFPLLPAFSSFEHFQSSFSHSLGINENTVINILNRQLLRRFLLNVNTHFLDKSGQQLCFITSKDVKPYQEWNIEYSLAMDTPLTYLGASEFDIKLFPEYKVRNVDRDKHVRDTKGQTYVWSVNPEHAIKQQLQPVAFQEDNCCQCCRAGPFISEQERLNHEKTKKHLKMQSFEKAWKQLLGIS